MLKITAPPDAGGTFHFHHDHVNAHPDHKHERAKPTDSFSCDVCGEYIREAQKGHPDNFVGWKVEGRVD